MAVRHDVTASERLMEQLGISDSEGQSSTDWEGDDNEPRVARTTVSPDVPVAQLKSFAQSLGVDVDRDMDLRWIVQKAFVSQLPLSWTEHCDSNGNAYFHNTCTGETTWRHPTDHIFQEVVEVVKVARSESSASSAARAVHDHLAHVRDRAAKQLSSWSGPYHSPGEDLYYYYCETRNLSTWVDPVAEWQQELDLREHLLRTCLLDKPLTNDMHPLGTSTPATRPSSNVDANPVPFLRLGGFSADAGSTTPRGIPSPPAGRPRSPNSARSFQSARSGYSARSGRPGSRSVTPTRRAVSPRLLGQGASPVAFLQTTPVSQTLVTQLARSAASSSSHSSPSPPRFGSVVEGTQKEEDASLSEKREPRGAVFETRTGVESTDNCSEVPHAQSGNVSSDGEELEFTFRSGAVTMPKSCTRP